MLSEHELDLLMQKLGIPDDAKRVAKFSRSSRPSRRVGSNGKNMPVQYASRKMGVTIQAESYKVELAGAHEMDHDPEVLEFYDQPPPFNLRFKVGNHMKEFPYTPDFFVIRKDLSDGKNGKKRRSFAALRRRIEPLPAR